MQELLNIIENSPDAVITHVEVVDDKVVLWFNYKSLNTNTSLLTEIKYQFYYGEQYYNCFKKYDYTTDYKIELSINDIKKFKSLILECYSHESKYGIIYKDVKSPKFFNKSWIGYETGLCAITDVCYNNVVIFSKGSKMRSYINRIFVTNIAIDVRPSGKFGSDFHNDKLSSFIAIPYFTPNKMFN